MCIGLDMFNPMAESMVQDIWTVPQKAKLRPISVAMDLPSLTDIKSKKESINRFDKQKNEKLQRQEKIEKSTFFVEGKHDPLTIQFQTNAILIFQRTLRHSALLYNLYFGLTSLC